MKLKSIALILFAVLFLSSPGYCLFCDDISPQQVQSSIKMQRVKDEQRKTQAEQVDSQTVDNLKAVQNQPISSSLSDDKTVSKQAFIESIKVEANQPMPQFKRITPQGMIVDTAQPLVALPITIAKKEEKKSSHGGFIFLLLVLCIVGVMSFKQQKNK
ncbi:MAG: hypothetical protein KJ915_05085 [Candidatus Omnitrophica bacterium]|nr:hypothetical protein [Candidatus Omnitrophota bacterium]